ncbi:MAG: flagellar biosynthesis repressor FlbT [Parvularculaceae bacterium]
MSGLVIKLRPFEKLLVNGAVLQNGSRATRLRVTTQNASILRLRDAMRPGEATTSAEKIYYIAQLAVAGEAEIEEAISELVSLITLAAHCSTVDLERDVYAGALAAAEAGRFYSVMRALRPLISLQGPPYSGGS